MGKKKKDKQAKITDIVAIIDRSGSMAPLAADASGGFNQFVKDQQEDEHDSTLTLVQFDHDIETVFEKTPINDVGEYTLKPGGSTALYDAIGQTLSKFESKNPVMVVIITDGGENASREWRKDAIKTLMDERRAEHWGFVFLSSDESSFQDGISFGVNTVSYQPSAQGTRISYNTASAATMSYKAAHTSPTVVPPGDVDGEE